MCPVEVESADQSGELNFYRDDARPGYVLIEATHFGSGDALTASENDWTEPLGSYRIRDLLIALSALSATPRKD